MESQRDVMKIHSYSISIISILLKLSQILTIRFPFERNSFSVGRIHTFLRAQHGRMEILESRY